jgi:MIP family channel proteins
VPKSWPRPSTTSRFAAEAFGTFALTLAGCAVEAAAAMHPEISHAERAAAPGLMVLALIFAVSDVSGAHINPAVTVAFAARGVFAWASVPLYWAAQMLGAVLAGAVSHGIFGPAAAHGVTTTALGGGRALVVEALLTMLLVSVILHTSKRHATVGTNAAVAVGATITLCGFWGGPLTGASMNPARSLGPALVEWQGAQAWLYVAGPLLGVALALVFAYLIHGPASASEAEAASGDGGDS